MNWKCFFGFHPWTKWTKWGRLHVKGRTLAYVYTRDCPICGKVDKEEKWFG